MPESTPHDVDMATVEHRILTAALARLPTLTDEDVYYLNATAWSEHPAESIAEAKRRLAAVPVVTADQRKPQRRFQIEVHIGADDWDWAIRELERLVLHIQAHGPVCNQVSGSPDAGSWVRITETPGMTHEQYHAELQVYLDRLRAAEAWADAEPRIVGKPPALGAPYDQEHGLGASGGDLTP